MDKSINNLTCIILAGGFGTRLQSVVSNVAKPMAPMGNKPFLQILMDYLHNQGIARFVLALGYKADSVTQHFDEKQVPYAIQYVYEKEPLGTGGAIKNALSVITDENILVVNGDTFFEIQVKSFVDDAKISGAAFFMALMEKKSTNRFGAVQIENTKVISFGTPHADGLNNAGVYFIKKSKFLEVCQADKLSLEEEIFPRLLLLSQLHGKKYDAYFVDIGIPEDYMKAKNKLGKIEIDSSWSLFLDRDGVINKRIVDDYVKSVDEFHFIEGSLAAIAELSKLFERIVVVTNQQGIGKGIMTERNLSDVHRYMLSEIEREGGKIDAVYFAPQLSSENSEMRKPNPGMALQAKQDFTEIDFSKSVLIGDSDSDVRFGQNLGMITVKLDNIDPCKSSPELFRASLAECIELFNNVTFKN